MPIYEFTCPECGHKHDDLVPVGTTENKCLECGATARKSAGSYLSSAHGLENGHHAVGRKLTTKDKARK